MKIPPDVMIVLLRINKTLLDMSIFVDIISKILIDNGIVASNKEIDKLYEEIKNDEEHKKMYDTLDEEIEKITVGYILNKYLDDKE